MRAVVALAALFAVTPAAAQSKCGPAAEVLAYLKEHYQERPVFEGSSGSFTVTIYLNQQTGSWTILSIDHEATLACIGAAGLKSRVLEALHPGDPT